MHRTIGYLSRRLIHIHPGEGQKVTLTFLYFFLVITAYYVIKPVSRSLVLDGLGSRLVPYADLICVLLMGPIVTIFARLVDRIEKPRLVSLAFLSVTGIILLFWTLLKWPQPWLAGAFYIWVSIFSVLVVTLFWLVANDLYRPRDAKRLFGFIGSGGVLGGVAGSAIAAVGAQVIGTSNLLLLSAALLVACWVVVRKLWQLTPEGGRSEAPAAQKRKDTFLSDVPGFTQILMRSRYLLFLMVLVGLNKMIATLINYQVNPFIEQMFLTADAKTTFNSLFNAGVNTVAFIVQFFFTSWILRRQGLSVALLLLPIGLLAGTTTMLFIPVFWVAALTELYDASLNYSLYNTSKEVLYLPIDRSIRYKVKPFIDMVVFRFGKGMAAVLGILLPGLLSAPGRLSVLIGPLLLVWVLVAICMRREYTMTIRTLLQAKTDAARLAAAGIVSDSAPSPGSLEEAWEGLIIRQGPHLKLSLANRLMNQAASVQVKELLAILSSYEGIGDNLGALQGMSLPQLRLVIQDRTQPLATRVQATKALARQADQDTFDYFCGIVLTEEEFLLRHEVVRELVKMRLSQRTLQVPSSPLRRQIAHEVRHYQHITRVAAIYRQQHQHHGPLAADDPAINLLRVLAAETFDQIFRFLMLLYRPEDIQLVYKQLKSSDTYLRSDAIELLDNLIDSTMRMTLFPILDEDRFLAMFDGHTLSLQEPTASYQILHEAIWDHDAWLSVTTLCAIGRLRLMTLRPELEAASNHTTALISLAAKVALQLARSP